MSTTNRGWEDVLDAMRVAEVEARIEGGSLYVPLPGECAMVVEPSGNVRLHVGEAHVHVSKLWDAWVALNVYQRSQLPQLALDLIPLAALYSQATWDDQGNSNTNLTGRLVVGDDECRIERNWIKGKWHVEVKAPRRGTLPWIAREAGYASLRAQARWVGALLAHQLLAERGSNGLPWYTVQSALDECLVQGLPGLEVRSWGGRVPIGAGLTRPGAKGHLTFSTLDMGGDPVMRRYVEIVLNPEGAVATSSPGFIRHGCQDMRQEIHNRNDLVAFISRAAQRARPPRPTDLTAWNV